MPGYAFGLGDLMSYAGPLLIRTFDWGNGQAAQHRQLAAGSLLLAVLGAGSDSPAQWLKVGQALDRVLLTHRTKSCHQDMLGDLHRDFNYLPGPLNPSSSQVCPTVGADLQRMLHPLGWSHPHPCEAVSAPFSGFLPGGPLPGGWFITGHSGRPPGVETRFQLCRSPLQLGNGGFLLRDSRPQLGNECQQGLASCRGQVQLCVHAPGIPKLPAHCPNVYNPF